MFHMSNNFHRPYKMTGFQVRPNVSKEEIASKIMEAVLKYGPPCDNVEEGGVTTLLWRQGLALCVQSIVVH